MMSASSFPSFPSFPSSFPSTGGSESISSTNRAAAAAAEERTFTRRTRTSSRRRPRSYGGETTPAPRGNPRNSHRSHNRQRNRSSPGDWRITNFDVATTHKPNLEDELRRLQTLRTLLPLAIGDAQAVPSPPTLSSNNTEGVSAQQQDQQQQQLLKRRCDEASREAARLVGAPSGYVSLVDLGQTLVIGQYSVQEGETDMEHTKESQLLQSTPRKESLCAHTILSKSGILVVPDAATDARFQHLPIVMQGTVRGYVGFALVLDGAAIGTLSVVDSKPWPVGESLLTDEFEKMLRNGPVQDVLQAWEHARLQHQLAHPPPQQSPLQQTPQHSRPPTPSSSTSKDGSCSLPDQPVFSLQGLLLTPPPPSSHRSAAETLPSPPLPSAVHCRVDRPFVTTRAPTGHHHHHHSNPHHPNVNDGGTTTLGLVPALVHGLELVAHIVPKHVDVLFQVATPLVGDDATHVVALPPGHDATLFRAAAAVLTTACRRTTHGRIAMAVRLHHHPQPEAADNHHQYWLEIACEDTAGTILPPRVFQSPGTWEDAEGCDDDDEDEGACCARWRLPHNVSSLGERGTEQQPQRTTPRWPDLSPVAEHVTSLGGKCGVRSRSSDGNNDALVGSIVWIQVPVSVTRTGEAPSDIDEPAAASLP